MTVAASSKKRDFVWGPQDLGAFGGFNPTKGAYRGYAVATKLADWRTGCFVATKTRLAALMGCCKRTADNAFAELVEAGIVSREETIRSKRQRANRWTLNPRHMWRLAAVNARAKYEAIMAKLKQLRVAKQARLQLLNGVKTFGAGTTAEILNEDDVRQAVVRRAIQHGYGLDYDRQEREVEEWLLRMVS